MEKRSIQKMTDDEIAGLEEEIRSATYHLEGALSMISDPYARGNLHKHLDNLSHSANKWLDTCIERANGPVPTAQPLPRADEASETTSSEKSAEES